MWVPARTGTVEREENRAVFRNYRKGGTAVELGKKEGEFRG
jgi:hypothetical protein